MCGFRELGLLLSRVYTAMYDQRLLIGGQVECNPGPTKYPCGICTRAVKTAQHGVAMVVTNVTNASSINSMTTPEYSHLVNTSRVWICSACNAQNSNKITPFQWKRAHTSTLTS